MALEDLIRMANQIVSNLVAFPEDTAADEAAKHIRSYWTPAMRAELLEYDDAGGQLLSAGARRALERLRALSA